MNLDFRGFVEQLEIIVEVESESSMSKFYSHRFNILQAWAWISNAVVLHCGKVLLCWKSHCVWLTK